MYITNALLIYFIISNIGGICYFSNCVFKSGQYVYHKFYPTPDMRLYEEYKKENTFPEQSL